jgi:hypothetical protein
VQAAFTIKFSEDTELKGYHPNPAESIGAIRFKPQQIVHE